MKNDVAEGAAKGEAGSVYKKNSALVLFTVPSQQTTEKKICKEQEGYLNEK